MTHQRTDAQVITDAQRFNATKRALSRFVNRSIKGKGRGALKAAIERAATVKFETPEEQFKAIERDAFRGLAGRGAE